MHVCVCVCVCVWCGDGKEWRGDRGVGGKNKTQPCSYADAVNNHMTGGGNDIQNHRNGGGSSCTEWGPKSSSALSPYFTQDYNFVNNSNTQKHPGLEYPAVPFFTSDFHCERSLNSWTDPFILNAGWLVGLSDLNSELPYVRQRVADYWTELLSFGYVGCVAVRTVRAHLVFFLVSSDSG